MKAVYCPYCGGRTKRNGRTSSGSQRWRCTACGASTTLRCDDTAARLGEFLGWSPGTWPGRGTRGRGRPSWRRSSLLAGQALHDDAAEAPGGVRALPHRVRPHGYRDAAPGRALGRALPRLVRVLGRLPGGQDRGGGRRACTHERLMRARSSLSSLVSAGTLFTYLDHRDPYPFWLD